MSKSDFKLTSLIGNFQAFVEPLTDMELSSLCYYMTVDFNDSPPNEIAKAFIEEFLGHNEWVKYLQDYRSELAGANSMFRPMMLLEEVANLKRFLMAESSFRFHKHLQGHKIQNEKRAQKKIDVKWDNLKNELAAAIDESYFDGSFDKIEGFCNISDVLLKYELVKYPEE